MGGGAGMPFFLQVKKKKRAAVTLIASPKKKGGVTLADVRGRGEKAFWQKRGGEKQPGLRCGGGAKNKANCLKKKRKFASEVRRKRNRTYWGKKQPVILASCYDFFAEGRMLRSDRLQSGGGKRKGASRLFKKSNNSR